MPQTNDSVVELPPDAATSNDHRNPRGRRRQETDAPPVGVVVWPEPERHTFDRLVLHEHVKQDITSALHALRVSRYFRCMR